MTPSLDYQPGASPPRFDITVDRAPVGIAHFDETGRFLYANPQLCALFGLTRDELLAKTFQEISFPDDLPRCLAMTQQLAAGAIPRYTLEKRFQRRDGSFVFTRVIVTVVRPDDGSRPFFLGVVEDLSEQWEAERARREAEAVRIRQRAEHVHRLGDHRTEKLCPRLDAESSRLDALHIEQVLDEPLHAFGRSPHQDEGPPLAARCAVPFGRRRLVEEECAGHENRAQRIPQIVRDDGEHLVARARRLAGLVVQSRILDRQRGSSRELLGMCEVVAVIVAAGIR